MPSTPILARRTALLGLSALFLTACVGGSFETAYDPVPASLAQTWRLAEVRVSVPKSLSVSEAKSLLPNADIVWREDPLGDRHAQVGKIVQNAVLRGAQGPARVASGDHRHHRHPLPRPDVRGRAVEQRLGGPQHRLHRPGRRCPHR